MESVAETLEGLLELYSTSETAAFPRACIRLLGAMLPSLFVSCHRFDIGSARHRVLCDPEEHGPTAERLRRLAFAKGGGARGIQILRKRTREIDDALALTIQPTPATRMTFVLARGGAGFSESERRLAASLQPHLLRAYEVVLSLGNGRTPAVAAVDPSTASALLQRRFGLTGRESELLYWLARGKSNREIGIISGISARTVDKHLQHVFEKLDVESRHAAVVQALQAIGPA
jgi:DNA-binding CsgD family transcriptional regulator